MEKRKSKKKLDCDEKGKVDAGREGDIKDDGIVRVLWLGPRKREIKE
jgi:hypothetical protein